MNIGLFGGSFDPIHNGHLALVQGMADALSLDRVVLMPTGQPPHKIKTTATTDDERLTLCRLATADDERLTVSRWEIDQGGASFTVDTLEALRTQYPDATWYLIMGADMFMSLSGWKRFEDLVHMAVFCTVPRDDVNAKALRDYAAELAAHGARCHVVDLPLMPLSSTAVRDAIAHGESIASMVPLAVASYIEEHGLYKETVEVDRYGQYRRILASRLTPQRYIHSLAVAKEARRLAERYGVDPEKAYTAGLLHDIMKNTKCDTQLQILKDFGILLDTVEQRSEKLWHAITGAAFLERVLGVTDGEILSAVRYHTTGRAAMTPLERVLFLADFTSEDRTYPDVDVMRRLVDTDECEAMRYALQYTIKELVSEGRPVHPDTIHAYNDVTLKRGE